MFDGPIVDVAIGLIFFYVVLSLICSAIQELVASTLGLRSSNLEKGIRNLLGDTCAEEFYGHPLIKHLSKHGKKPSYVRPSIFAAALLDVVGRREDEDGAKALNSDQVYAALEKWDGSSLSAAYCWPCRAEARSPSTVCALPWPTGTTRRWIA